ncbi:MAG TPA: multidrug effflux MFS transporter [Propionibacteriaceae bacterium]|nr:multidrug effflux MFS transporter [Propionibacteriaceae bacterium]
MADEAVSPRPRVSSNALLTTMIAALAMIGPFTIDAVFPAYDLIGREIHASTGEMQQVTSVYMLSFAVMSLFHGPISDAVGRKKVMAVGMLAYALASLVCMVAPNLTVLLLGRILQGAFAGAGQIVSRTIVRDVYVGPAAQKMMAQVAMIFAIAPAIAPIVGGWVVAFASWRTIFGGLFVVGLLLAAMVAFAVPETHPLEKRRALNVGDVLKGVRIVLSDRPYLRLAFAGMFGFGAQFIYIVGAPIIMLQLLHKGEQDFWMLFVPFVCGMILGSYVNARLAHRIPPQRLVSIAMVALVSAALLGVVVAALAGNHLPWVMICPPVIAFAMAASFPILQLAMLDRFPTRRGAAASGQSFIQLLFNAVLSGVIVTLVATSMLSVAITSAVSGIIGGLFWLWHRRRPAPPRADQA